MRFILLLAIPALTGCTLSVRKCETVTVKELGQFSQPYCDGDPVVTSCYLGKFTFVDTNGIARMVNEPVVVGQSVKICKRVPVSDEE
ncbi:hypothetical protein UFOVP1351_32 [uncultured Caudovirales phage]|uniref:Lipoprotein n=1 Tax=uncultured Caudovirales phage TaxID=2100421 RepID=A0A6J5RSC0_9CAUD|nr:hypothetical protein UFOVP1351_32 [uncultured Caudovirales phage]